jgi:hypothetical protein
MKTFLIVVGAIIILISLPYFFRIVYLLFYNTYEFTNFGYGILAGRIIMLIAGFLLLYLGVKYKKRG